MTRTSEYPLGGMMFGSIELPDELVVEHRARTGAQALTRYAGQLEDKLIMGLRAWFRCLLVQLLAPQLNIFADPRIMKNLMEDMMLAQSTHAA